MSNQILSPFLLFTVLLPSLAVAQNIPKKIHDLKSLTDSSGTVHLFYRIQKEHKSGISGNNTIYHYNSETDDHVQLMSDYYNHHENFLVDQHVLDYKFLDNNPENFTYTYS